MTAKGAPLLCAVERGEYRRAVLRGGLVEREEPLERHVEWKQRVEIDTLVAAVCSEQLDRRPWQLFRCCDVAPIRERDLPRASGLLKGLPSAPRFTGSPCVGPSTKVYCCRGHRFATVLTTAETVDSADPSSLGGPSW